MNVADKSRGVRGAHPSPGGGGGSPLRYRPHTLRTIYCATFSFRKERQHWSCLEVRSSIFVARILKSICARERQRYDSIPEAIKLLHSAILYRFVCNLIKNWSQFGFFCSDSLKIIIWYNYYLYSCKYSLLHLIQLVYN